jgi:UDP-glucose 4-epimerase
MICHADERNSMILVTGGSGFIGSHTVRALHGLGEPSVVMQRRSGQVPPHLADLPVVAEQADVADLDSLRAIGGRHEITGIVHLAGYPAPRGTAGGVEATQGLLDGLLNIARAAAEWGVRRVSLASTLGVYGGIAHSGPLTEDLPVLLTAPHPIPRSKKIAELLGEQLAEATGAEIVSLRISGTWGPLGHEDPFFAAPALIHAAASGKPLDLSALLIPPHLGDGLDLCYVKDTGRAIALIQLAGHLQHRTYNIASGRVTTNAEVIAAIREAVPEAALGLPAGAGRPGAALDITRLRQDTGFEPEYDTVRAAAGYIAWLRAGNER